MFIENYSDQQMKKSLSIPQDRARNVSERLTATTTIVINVEDSDDLDPSFIYG